MPRTRASKDQFFTGVSLHTAVEDKNVVFRYPQRYIKYYETITDENNKRLRPNSPCSHKKSWCEFTPRSPYTYYGGGFYNYRVTGEVSNRGCSAVSEYLNAVCSPQIADFQRAVQRKVYAEHARLKERWSSINFLAELGDIGGMIKRLDKYRYTDYAFGIRPFLQDVMSINERINTTTESLNAKLASYRDASRKPFSAKKSFFISGNENVSYFVADSSFTEYNLRLSCYFKGEAFVSLPVIGTSSANDDEYYLDMLKLDNEGFHPDLATLWEAIPFSWLIDWIFPIGSYFEGLSGSWFNPVVNLSGTFATRVVGTFKLRNANVGKPYYNQTEIEGGMDYYTRSAFGSQIDSRTAKLPKVSVPKIDLSRMAILNDVFGSGTSVDDVRKPFRGKRR